MKRHDVTILGGGIAGYVAAIRGKQLGLDVAVIEPKKLGGTCLHRGCIPTKALLESARILQTIINAETFGIICEEPRIDFVKIQARKEKVINRLFRGLNHIFQREQIPIYPGYAQLVGNQQVQVNLNEGQAITLAAKKGIILATGSRPRQVLQVPLNNSRILNTDHLLEIEEAPKSLIIIGGGVIGVEFASLYSDLGIPVIVIEQASALINNEDQDIQKELQRQLTKKGVKILLNTKVSQVQETNEQVIVTTDGEHQLEITGDYCLLSVGREPNANNLGLENTKIQLNQGFVKVDSVYQTSEPNIFAIGDLIGGKMLAHAASYQGMRVMEYIGGVITKEEINDVPIPSCIYSNPEIASVGLTEQQAQAAGHHLKVSKFFLQANGKASVYNQDGFIKLIADQETDDLLGAHIIGPRATELISTVGVGLFLNASSWELSQVVYPHPTIAEAIGEAALALNSGAIHK